MSRLRIVTWYALVLVVVLYAAGVMFRAAFAGRREHRAEDATAHVNS